jgi:hypothetical protein
MRRTILVLSGIAVFGAAAAAQRLGPAQRSNHTSPRVAIVSCLADNNGQFQFRSGDVNGRPLDFGRALQCSEALALLARDGFAIAPATTTQQSSGFTPDQATTMTAIALAESGGNH